MGKDLSAALIRKAMAAMGSKGGKRSMVTMTAAERSARAKKASTAAAKKRTADRLAAEAKTKKKVQYYSGAMPDLSDQGKKLPHDQQVRTPEELDRIRRNMHSGIAASKGTVQDFDDWFDKTYPKKPETPRGSS